MENYLEGITDSLLMYRVGRFDIKGKEYLLVMDNDPPASYNGIRQKYALDWLLGK